MKEWMTNYATAISSKSTIVLYFYAKQMSQHSSNTGFPIWVLYSNILRLFKITTYKHVIDSLFFICHLSCNTLSFQFFLVSKVMFHWQKTPRQFDVIVHYFRCVTQQDCFETNILNTICSEIVQPVEKISIVFFVINTTLSHLGSQLRSSKQQSYSR